MENNTDNIGWILIPPTIASRKDLTYSEKMLLGKINGLINAKGYCFASNEWLANQIGIDSGTVSNAISKFVNLKLLHREIICNEKKEIIERQLYPLSIEQWIPIHHTMDTPIHHTMEDIYRDKIIENSSGEKEKFQDSDTLEEVLNKEKERFNANKERQAKKQKFGNPAPQQQYYQKKKKGVFDARDIV